MGFPRQKYWSGLPFSSPICIYYAAAAAASLQSCSTLCDPIDGSPPGSPIPGILQARTLEWVAISFSNAWKWKVKVKSLSRVQLFMTPWTAADQAPPSMGFSRQECWSGVPLPLFFYCVAGLWFCAGLFQMWAHIHRRPPSMCIQTTSGQSVAFSLGRGQWARLPKPTVHSRFLAGLCTSFFFF